MLGNVPLMSFKRYEFKLVGVAKGIQVIGLATQQNMLGNTSSFNDF